MQYYGLLKTFVYEKQSWWKTGLSVSLSYPSHSIISYSCVKPGHGKQLNFKGRILIILVKKFPIHKMVQGDNYTEGWIIKKRDWMELLYLIIQTFNNIKESGALKMWPTCLTIF